MKETINLLWTGGWDSTFRLLDLILIKKRRVQPYYMVSRIGSTTSESNPNVVQGRASCDLEMQTMDKIRNLILKSDPESRELLLPTIYYEVAAIAPDGEITQQYVNLLSAKHLGSQYDYLARFALQQGIKNLELSIHKDDHAQKFIEPYVVQEEDGNYRLMDNPSYTELALFKYFRFPILNLTKLDMEASAKKYNFLDIMNETVFCHTPLANGKPCGRCNPCRYTMKEGLSRRIPLVPRLKYQIKQIIKPYIKPILKFFR